MARLPVPEEFRPADPMLPYPPHQRGPLVEPFFHAFHEANADRFPEDWIYLPVFWTAYYARHEFGWRPLRRLQAFLDESLDPSAPYFTIVQHADGILNLLPDSVVVFGAGGRGDVPIPLLSSPHPPAAGPRDLLASFVGAPTHWARRRLAQTLAGDPRFLVLEGRAESEGIATFEALMARSEFALCPRGHGRTSFRLFEAIAMGVPPVYVFDEPWLPFADELNWREFSVLVHVDELPWLPAILESIPAERREAMRRELARVADGWFGFDGCAERILERVQRMAAKGFERPVVGRSRNEARFRSRWTDETRRHLGRPRV